MNFNGDKGICCKQSKKMGFGYREYARRGGFQTRPYVLNWLTPAYVLYIIYILYRGLGTGLKPVPTKYYVT